MQYFYDEQDRLCDEIHATRITLNPTGWRNIAGRVPSERPLTSIIGFFGGVTALLVLAMALVGRLGSAGSGARRGSAAPVAPASRRWARRLRRRRLRRTPTRTSPPLFPFPFA